MVFPDSIASHLEKLNILQVTESMFTKSVPEPSKFMQVLEKVKTKIRNCK